MDKPKVIIIMGSDSDLAQMAGGYKVLLELGIDVEVHVSSAHRTPGRTHDIITNGEKNGVEVFIAAAGGAAHLAGVVSSLTCLPVIGVPIKTNLAGGLDSLLSTVQMPPGIPVATVGVGGSKNAGILAAQILSIKYDYIKDNIKQYRKNMADNVMKKDDTLNDLGVIAYLDQMK